MNRNEIIGFINFQEDLNEYTIKCNVYNKLTKLGLVTYKNVWEVIDNDKIRSYLLQTDDFLIELKCHILTLYSNDIIKNGIERYKYFKNILEQLG
jgi:hypothetical protein